MNIAEQVAALPEPERTLVESASTVQLALLFSEDARTRANEAEQRLVAAMNASERALEYLKRTTITLEQAIRLHVMGRV